LHLDTWIVEAIEANRFLALGAPVYAKGYLRRYAALLGLAPEVIVARYEALGDALAEPTPVPLITTTPRRPQWPKYLGWALLAAIVIAVGVVLWRWFGPLLVQDEAVSSGEVTQAPVVADAPSAPSSVAESPAVSAATAAPPVAETAAEPRTSEGRASVGPASIEPATDSDAASASVVPTRVASPPAAVASADTVRLRLVFKDASWVEVHDAKGRRLLYDIGQPDRPRVVSGAAPLNVVIGVASAVTAQVNDQPIVIPRNANRDAARFAIDANGAVSARR